MPCQWKNFPPRLKKGDRSKSYAFAWAGLRASASAMSLYVRSWAVRFLKPRMFSMYHDLECWLPKVVFQVGSLPNHAPG